MLNNTACGSVRALLQQLQNAVHVTPVSYAQGPVCTPKQQGVNCKVNMIVVVGVCAGQICIMAHIIFHPICHTEACVYQPRLITEYNLYVA